MAVTKIWAVKSRLDHVLDYALNKQKTENPQYASTDMKRVEDVLAYITDDLKTQEHFYVTAINCSAETAKEEMMITKKQFQKTEGILAFHAYQSFAYGEVTPEQAHEIGVKLATELWGGRFEVVVSTHLDKKHLHNHFVLNSVSFVDGKRYYDTHKTYAKMREVSDRLCRKQALSVVENPQTGRRYSYDAYMAKQDGKPTWDSEIIADIEMAITSSRTMHQFLGILHDMGYERKCQAKYFTLRPKGKERFVRIDRRYPEYSLEKIKERILSQNQIRSRYQSIIVKPKVRKVTGFQALYFYYGYLLGVFPKGRKIKKETLPFILREDVKKLEQITKETRFLCRNEIDTSRELSNYQEQTGIKIEELTKERTKLRNQCRRTKEPDEVPVIKERITAITKELAELRIELKCCTGIAKRSQEITEKLDYLQEENRLENEKAGKEKETYEHIR